MSEAPERISVESDEFTLDPTQSKVNIGPIKDPIYIGEEAMMGKAPERITVWPDVNDHFNPPRSDWSGGYWDDTDDPGGTEYIRADLVQAAVAAALTEAAEIVTQDIEAVRAEEGKFSGTAFSMEQDAKKILALITHDAQAALDWVVAQRIKELKGPRNE